MHPLKRKTALTLMVMSFNCVKMGMAGIKGIAGKTLFRSRQH
jgi:hypothetical protein